MKHSVLFHRSLLVSSLLTLTLTSGSTALAQKARTVAPVVPALERIESTPSTDSVSFIFEGFVVAPDAALVEGAVVVSSAGGQAVTDAAGSFRLEARVPLEAESVQITAVGSAGQNLVANQQIFLSPEPGRVWVGPLRLTRGSSCNPSWLPTFGGYPGTTTPGVVNALAVFDDGTGAALYAGGAFRRASGVLVNSVAKWDGSSWTRLGSGLDYSVFALAVFDDGGGEALFAAGSFKIAGGEAASLIAKWDGSSWARLGSGVNYIYAAALTVFDDGDGAALYVGGSFTIAGGVAASRIAKWDGSSWAPLGSGLSGFRTSVNALAVFNDGGGEALYVGGSFTSADGVAANRIAKWDGSSWSPLGRGLGAVVWALTVFDDGSGPALYAGGEFFSFKGSFTVKANRVAKWDGVKWTPVGSGVSGDVNALTVFDDGNGDALHAGGEFPTAGGVAKWDGASWSPLGTGMNNRVRALAVFDDGNGAALHASGQFTTAGGVAALYIAKWDGASWSPLGGGMDSWVLALTGFDEGGGEALYAGGRFRAAFDSGDSYLARWGCPDTTPPVLTCPPSVHSFDLQGTDPGEYVSYSVSAVDDLAPAPVVVCTPPSGSFFARGTTIVTCTATDPSGNHATCEFPVHVQVVDSSRHGDSGNVRSVEAPKSTRRRR